LATLAVLARVLDPAATVAAPPLAGIDFLCHRELSLTRMEERRSGNVPHVNRRLLAIYLNDHLAGATLAVHVIRRGLKADPDHPIAPVLQEVLQDVEEDRATLIRFMEVLGISRSPAKAGAAWIAERVGRLKLNGQVVRRSPLSRLEELEVLILGIQGKRRLWTTLARLDLPPEVGGELDRLVSRADAQTERLEARWASAVREALGGDRLSA